MNEDTQMNEDTHDQPDAPTDASRPGQIQPNVLQLEFVVVRPFDHSDTTTAYHRVLRIESVNDGPDEQDWLDAERHLRVRLENEGLQDALYVRSDADYSDLPADVTLAGRL